MPIYRYQDRPDKWMVRISHRGRKHTWIVNGQKRDAERYEAEKRVEIVVSPQSAVRGVPKFGAFCRDSYRPHAELHLKAGTWTKQHYMVITLVEHFETERLDRIDAGAVDTYKRARLKDGLSPVSVNNETRVLTRILNYARELGYAVPQPRWKPLPEPGHDDTKAWSRSDLGRLFAACGAVSPALLPCVVLIANTGVRKGEAIALRWEDVDLPRRMIRVQPNAEWTPKNGKPREIPISDALAPWLDRGKRLGRYVFPSRKGTPYAEWPARAFDRARDATDRTCPACHHVHRDTKPPNCERCRAEFQPRLAGGVHTLRHTFATHFLEQCPDLYLLARILGHSEVAVTRRYAHLLPDHLARARNAVNVAPGVGPAEHEARRRWARE